MTVSDPGDERNPQAELGGRAWTAIGMAVGLVIGVALGNLPVGIVLSVAFAVGIGAMRANREGETEP